MAISKENHRGKRCPEKRRYKMVEINRHSLYATSGFEPLFACSRAIRGPHQTAASCCLSDLHELSETQNPISNQSLKPGFVIKRREASRSYRNFSTISRISSGLWMMYFGLNCCNSSSGRKPHVTPTPVTSLLSTVSISTPESPT